MDMDLINKGLLSQGSSENVKVEICNYLEESKVVASPQCHLIILAIALALRLASLEVSIIVFPNSSRRISCLLNSIIVLSAKNDSTFEYLPCLEIVNVTKDLSVLEFGVEIVYDYELNDKPSSLHRLLGMSKYSSYVFGVFVYLLAKSRRTLYRMRV
ncbi:hypothetical protein GOBAR_DD27724 [Gossypium barbadense]|nr:hypothetical protein GOBAR_DD27724 [Gossypium barbadense]